MPENSRLLWKSLSGISLLTIDLYVIFHGIRTETPVLNFPLLFLLHMLAIFVVLPSVLFSKIPFLEVARRGEILILIGGLTLLLGFLFVPRSLVVTESGFLILAGAWTLKRTFKKNSLYKNELFESIPFWGFFLTILTGVILGLTLARPMIDPIPFRGILLHGFTGIAFTLTAFSVTFQDGSRVVRHSPAKGIWTAFFYLSGITCLFTLPLIQNILIWIILSLLFLLFGLLLGYRFLYGQSYFGMLLLTGGIIVLSSSAWKASPGPSMTFFLLAWLYLLGGMSLYSEKAGRVMGTAGTFIFLFGVWDTQKEFLYIGFLTHFITMVIVVLLPLLRVNGHQVERTDL